MSIVPVTYYFLMHKRRIDNKLAYYRALNVSYGIKLSQRNIHQIFSRITKEKLPSYKERLEAELTKEFEIQEGKPARQEEKIEKPTRVRDMLHRIKKVLRLIVNQLLRTDYSIEYIYIYIFRNLNHKSNIKAMGTSMLLSLRVLTTHPPQTGLM